MALCHQRRRIGVDDLERVHERYRAAAVRIQNGCVRFGLVGCTVTVGVERDRIREARRRARSGDLADQSTRAICIGRHSDRSAICARCYVGDGGVDYAVLVGHIGDRPGPAVQADIDGLKLTRAAIRIEVRDRFRRASIEVRDRHVGMVEDVVAKRRPFLGNRQAGAIHACHGDIVRSPDRLRIRRDLTAVGIDHGLHNSRMVERGLTIGSRRRDSLREAVSRRHRDDGCGLGVSAGDSMQGIAAVRERLGGASIRGDGLDIALGLIDGPITIVVEGRDNGETVGRCRRQGQRG